MLLLIIILLLMVVTGPLPYWPWSRDWGYAPFFITLGIVAIWFLAGLL